MMWMLAWKELHEHRLIWLTMVFMTALLGTGLSRLVGMTSAADAELIAGCTILGMAATYGVVCGSMMFAGEHEGGTMVFLDVFWGRRGLLWGGKSLIGVVFVLAQAIAVALVLGLLNQAPPTWGLSLVGQPGVIDLLPARRPMLPLTPAAWYVILPVVTLEAYAWGLFGSAVKRRVLPAAGVACMGAFPFWLVLFAAPPLLFFGVRLLATGVVLMLSCYLFFAQQPEVALEAVAPREVDDSRDRLSDLWSDFSATLEMTTSVGDPRRRVLDLWDEIKHAERKRGRQSQTDDPVPPPLPEALHEPWRPRERPQAESPREVLWWLTWQQASGLLPFLAPLAFFIGFFLAADGQVLWPLFTLLIGVACGTAAFGPEQSDLSYQFLSAQHLPLPTIWRFKIAFWSVTAVLLALIVDMGAFAGLMGKSFVRRGLLGAEGDMVGFHVGSLRAVMGPILFYGIWLTYGFAAGQLLVWFCRKNIFAILAGTLVAAGAVGMWLPSFLCGGMNGWAVWLPPLTMLAASYFLMRAWAGGRIKERRPLAALIGFASIVLVWMGANFVYRAWEIPDVGEPLDTAAFRASLPAANANVAGRKIQQACSLIRSPGIPWLAQIEGLPKLPLGVIDVPSASGQFAGLEYGRDCLTMVDSLGNFAEGEKAPDRAFDYLALALALSRNLRNKAPLSSYSAGIKAEKLALQSLDALLARGKPSPAFLARVLEELNRHAAATPSALDGLQAECFRSSGVLARPQLWTFNSPDPIGGRDQRWLANSVALSMETPWEAERKMRLWRQVWTGLLRGAKTPYWELPSESERLGTSTITWYIVSSWIPADSDSGDSMTTNRLSRLLEDSWLSDSRLFPAGTALATLAAEARWRVGAKRQAIAVALFQRRGGSPPNTLKELVPKYLREGLPVDPFTGQAFHYRVSTGEEIENIGVVRAGQAVLWSAGPDGIDDGGTRDGSHLFDLGLADKQVGFDLVTVVPNWP